MDSHPRFDFDRNERRAALDRLAGAYSPPKGSQTSRAACVRVLRCIESHLGRDERGALADEWRLTVETIATETGMSDRTVRYAIFQLERDHLIYLTEYRVTGWRSHSYRIIWGNIEAAGEVKEEQKAETPKTVERGDRQRGVKAAKQAPLQVASIPLQLDPKPLQLGVATVATRSGNHCNSSIQNKKHNQIPPPPPKLSDEPIAKEPDWKEVEEALRKLGIGQARNVCRDARERGATPDDIRAAIEQWRTSTGFWNLGGLAYRVSNGTWPPPNRVAQVNAKRAVELRERLTTTGAQKGYSLDHIRFVTAMELRRLGLAEWITPQEAEQVSKREVAV